MAASIKLISPAGGSVTLTAPMTTDNFSFDIGGGTSLATLNVSNNLVVGGSANITGNLTFTGTSQRITGDFTNTLVPSRVIFQTSNTNSSTGIYAVPSGTSTAASWQAANTADPTNASKILIATNGSTDVQLVSGINGTGTYLPLTFYNGGSERMRLSNTGNFSIGTANTDTYKLNVNGNANISGTLTVNGTNITGSAGGGFSNMAVAKTTDANNSSGTSLVWNSTGSLTWTVPTAITTCKVTVVAGGGGGSGANSTGGGGGGAGGTAIRVVTGLTPGATVAVTVGAGGAAGAAGGAAAGAGGSSSFGTYATATGGGGGTSSAAASGQGGAGGAGNSGTFNISGGSGGNGCDYVGSFYIGGFGGNTIFGGGGKGGSATGATIVGTAGAAGTGAGGGGGGNGGSTVGYAGGTGVVIIEW